MPNVKYTCYIFHVTSKKSHSLLNRIPRGRKGVPLEYGKVYPSGTNERDTEYI